MVETRAAVQAEADDCRVNGSNEVYFVISGLERPATDLRGRDWHDAAKACVQPYIRELVGRELTIEHIINVSSRAPDAPARFQVKLETPELSRAVRSKFGSFFASGKDERPELFKDISIRNMVTQETRVRIAVLQV